MQLHCWKGYEELWHQPGCRCISRGHSEGQRRLLHLLSLTSYGTVQTSKPRHFCITSGATPFSLNVLK